MPGEGGSDGAIRRSLCDVTASKVLRLCDVTKVSHYSRAALLALQRPSYYSRQSVAQWDRRMSAAKSKKIKAEAPPSAKDLRARREMAQQRASAAKKEARAAKERAREARRLFKQAKKVAREAKKELERISAKLKKVMGAAVRANGARKDDARKPVKRSAGKKRKQQTTSKARAASRPVERSSSAPSAALKRQTRKRSAGSSSVPSNPSPEEPAEVTLTDADSEPSPGG